MYEDLNKRQYQTENEPNIHHLDIGGVGQLVGYTDEHGHQHEQDSQIHRYDGFKEEGFEEVCRMSYHIQKNSWKKDG